MRCRERDGRRLVGVFVFDDHLGFSATAALVVEASPGFGLIGVANSGPEGLELLRSGVEPDLLLIDVVMAPLTGFEVAEQYRAAGGQASIVLMSSYDTGDLPVGLSGSIGGICGFIAKVDLHPDGLASLWAQIRFAPETDWPAVQVHHVGVGVT